MLKYIRYIETGSDTEAKRKIVNKIENYGFICKFDYEGIHVFADEDTLWDRIGMCFIEILLIVACLAFTVLMLI